MMLSIIQDHVPGDPQPSPRDWGHCARKRCLLIFDNVEDDAPARLLPAGRTSVLITTRQRNLRFLRGYPLLDLPLLTEEQCFALFDQVMGKEEVQRHQGHARALFRQLGYLPIAVAVAAALIREDIRYTIAGMAADLPSDAYALLTEAVRALSSQAQVLLASMSACAPEGFRLTLAAEVAGMDEASSLDALQEMYARSLVQELDRTTHRYRVHSLVRAAAGVSDLLRQSHAEAVARNFKKWESHWHLCTEDMADWQEAFSWGLRSSGSVHGYGGYLADIAYCGYALMRRLGRMVEANEIAAQMIEVVERNGDRESRQAWYGNQALILQSWGRLEEAMALHTKQEAICVELGNRDGLQASYGNQALILQSWGRLEEAMALHTKQEAICVELGNRDGLQASYGNQALILKSWGRLEEAIALHQKEEAICVELGNQASLAYCYWIWGGVARDQGDTQAETKSLSSLLLYSSA